ncbi:type I restriction enzyme HsdR N-terminal domain-containing protein [Jiulongibacter sp. NS-SX5]|uniref:type I restriction enzyme HsdR N-terminal domain-containing protein n=1 Tax=Jiulongibacter sp. NS-SX5 TaxID=3463854 RepID=UPI0040592A00
MEKLNLPEFSCKITENEGKTFVFDILRKKNIVLTPEEWVRQHLVHLLIHHLSFGPGLIKLESGLKYESLDKRSDILIYDRQAKPYFLIECKAPDVAITQKTLAQVSRYNKTLKAPFIAVSNGKSTFCFEVDYQNDITKQMKGFPAVPV